MKRESSAAYTPPSSWLASRGVAEPRLSACAMISLKAPEAGMSDCRRWPALFFSRMARRLARARLTRLLTVPMAQPQMFAVSS